MNYHTIKNQQIIDQLVNREVYMCLTGIVSDLQELANLKGEYFFEDVENMSFEVPVANQYRYIIHDDDPDCFDANIFYIDEDGDDVHALSITREMMQEAQEDGHITDYEDAADVITHFFPDADVYLGEGEDVETETEYSEPLEWWAVSRSAFEKLRNEGEVVFEHGYTYVWGRQTSGQAIHLDNVWGRIAEDMEILEGQKCDWSKQ